MGCFLSGEAGVRESLTPVSKAGSAEQLCAWLPPLTSFSLYDTDRL